MPKAWVSTDHLCAVWYVFFQLFMSSLFSLSALFIFFNAIFISIVTYTISSCNFCYLYRCKEVVMATVRAIFDIVDTSTNQVSASQSSWCLGKVSNLTPFPEISHLMNYWVFFPPIFVSSLIMIFN